MEKAGTCCEESAAGPAHALLKVPVAGHVPSVPSVRLLDRITLWRALGRSFGRWPRRRAGLECRPKSTGGGAPAREGGGRGAVPPPDLRDAVHLKHFSFAQADWLNTSPR